MILEEGFKLFGMAKRFSFFQIFFGKLEFFGGKNTNVQLSKWLLRESFPLLVFKGLDKVIVFSSSHLEEGSDAIDLRVVHVQAFSDLFLLEKNC